MVVFYGIRNAGKVDQREGQYALTRFAHIYWLPLFPISSVWVVRDGMGHDMKMSGKSVLAGYARSWAFVFGPLGIFAGGGALMTLAVASVALAAWSMAWKDTSGDRAIRKSDMNLRAFGTRCEPKLLSSGLATTLEAELKDRWARVSGGQSPGDVARFGPEMKPPGFTPGGEVDDVERAAAAYGVLRLTAVQLPSAQAAEAEADALRIAEGVRDKLQITDGGPYRSTTIHDSLHPSKPAK